MTLDGLRQDCRHALRRLARDWRFTAGAVLILALGIGANTAIFSAINAALFRKQPLADPDRLVDIYQVGANPGGIDASSYPAYLDMAAYTDVFASITAVLVPRGATFQGREALRPAVIEHTTASYLTVLGLRPALGRWFERSEDARGAAVVAVVGYQSWIRKFGADPSIVGRTIRIDGVPVTIVGVGPAGHNATINLGIVTDFWLPISALPAFGLPPSAFDRRPRESVFLVKARLRDGVTVAQAQAAMHNLGTRLAADYPNEDPGKGIAVFASRDVRIHPQMDAVLAPLASIVLVVVGLVLAIACSNLATLLLVRGAARAKEVSVRLALGATRAQLVRLLLAESLLLSCAAGVAGCVLAWWAIRVLGAIDLPIVMDLTLDIRVLGFALALSILTGVAFGLAPALKSTRIELVPALHGGGETRSTGHRWLTLKNTLVVVQVAVSVVLLGATSIFLQMLAASRAQRVGFAVDGVAILETDARYAGYSPAAAASMAGELRRRVVAIPGVQSAALTRGLPMQVTGTRVVLERGNAGPAGFAGEIWAGPGFFETLRIPILHGRPLDERDRPETPRVAIISESMARGLFGAADAVGSRFRLEQEPEAWLQVVGVVADTGTADLGGDLVDPTPQLFYRPYTQADAPPTTVVARASFDALALAAAMQRELRSVDGALPVISATTMAQYLEQSLLMPKTVAAVLGGLGVFGLSLAGIGLYAVVAFAVSRRAREIGIRMALGARSGQVVWTVSSDVVALVAVGIGLGLTLSVMAILALRAVAAPAPGIAVYRPTPDPLSLASIALFMAAVALAAASMPALRAARMNPVSALRHD